MRDGFLAIERTGRRNRYRVRREVALRHPVEAHRNVGQILEWLAAGPPPVPTS